MATVSPQNNKFIYSRISFELAAAIKNAENNMLHIDDALIVAATPAVLLNYSSINDKEQIELLKASQPNDISDGHLLTQDFMYCISYHFLNLEESPKHNG